MSKGYLKLSWNGTCGLDFLDFPDAKLKLELELGFEFAADKICHLFCLGFAVFCCFVVKLGLDLELGLEFFLVVKFLIGFVACWLHYHFIIEFA